MEADTISRVLLGAAAAATGNGTYDGGYPDDCFCIPHLSHGSDFEKKFSIGCQWLAFVLSVLILIFYAWHSWVATTGWEEVYVCIIELIKVKLEIWHEFDSPATLVLNTGNHVLWLRYGEWLLTCPVILIHLSNITGLNDDYSPRTMRLLVSDIGTIVWGVTAACATGPIKVLFFVIGLAYGCNTFFTAAKIYIESYHSVPKGECQTLIKLMAWTFFTSWVMFPVLFAAGHEGLGLLSPYGSTIGHSVADLLSKNLWGLIGHHLRVKIHEHILEHGDYRKKTTIQIAGMDTEVEQFVDEEEDGAIKHSTADLANRRGSFLVMKNRMQERGMTVRASLDASGYPGEDEAMVTINTGTPVKAGIQMGAMPALMAPPAEPARVIVGLLDASQAEFFKQSFAALPVPTEVVPAIGADAILQITQQAINLGGADFILLQPEFLQDRTANGLVARLKGAGQRVCAFGWGAASPARELIENSGLDGWLEGPSWGAGLNGQQLLALVTQMQAKRKMGAGGWGTALTLGGQAASRPVSPLMAAANPLYGASTTPLSLSMTNAGGLMAPPAANLNMAMHSGIYGAAAPAPAPAQLSPSVPASPRAPSPATQGSGAVGEAEMLQALMGEINRLKSELGEN